MPPPTGILSFGMPSSSAQALTSGSCQGLSRRTIREEQVLPGRRDRHVTAAKGAVGEHEVVLSTQLKGVGRVLHEARLARGPDALRVPTRGLQAHHTDQAVAPRRHPKRKTVARVHGLTGLGDALRGALVHEHRQIHLPTLDPKVLPVAGRDRQHPKRQQQGGGHRQGRHDRRLRPILGPQRHKHKRRAAHDHL